MKHNQKGFTFVEAMLVLVAVVLVGFAGWYVWSKNQEDQKSVSDIKKQTQVTNKQTILDPNNVLKLASDSVSLTLPQGWAYAKGNDMCPITAGDTLESAGCLDGANITVDGVRTEWRDGPQYLNIRVGVYNNAAENTPQQWAEGYNGLVMEDQGDTVSDEKINGYSAFFWKTATREDIHEVRYAFTANDKVVYIEARTYKKAVIDGKIVGDFRKFEPQIEALAHSIKIN